MSFNSRSEFISAQNSEKITIAHVEGRQRVLPFTLVSGTIYSKTVDFWVINVHNTLTQLTAAASEVALPSGQWYFKPSTKVLYVNVGADPDDSEIIATYRFFYSTAPMDIPYNLLNSGTHVHYEGRIQLAPPYKHKIGVDQSLISIIGNGSLKLINTDGGLDEIYDKIIFDNQAVQIYSWNRDLPITSKKIIYRGRVVQKRFQPDNVSFMVKDELVNLDQDIPQNVFSADDGVNKSSEGQTKRWIYGKVDGLLLQGTDQIADGYLLTGTVSVSVGSTNLVGTGTSFLTELSPDDRIIVGTQEFTIEDVITNTSATLNGEPDYAVSASPATVVPDVPVRFKNRDFFIADHESAQLTRLVVTALQLNRVQLDSTVGLNPGDFLEFQGGDRIEIEKLATGDIVVLRQNLQDLPAPASSVIRQPVQQVYIQGALVPVEDYTINNSGDTSITFDEDVEFNLTRTEEFGFSATFTNGSNLITTANDIDLKEILEPRDWIKPSNLSYSTFYEILKVESQQITLRGNFTDSTITEDAQGKRPEYIDDSTVISANVLGRTVTGLAAGDWIQTAAQVMRDLLEVAGLTEINETSFTDGSETTSQLISLAIPTNVGSSLTKYKTVIDRLARSTNSVVTLDNDLKVKYKVLNAEWPTDPLTINDFDVIKWSVESTSGKNIRNSIVRYRKQDVIRETLEPGFEVSTFSSDFVEKYVGTNETEEIETLLYKEFDARVFSHRMVYNQSVARTEVELETDLRLEDVEIGQVIIMDFNRLYKRFGDSTSRKKAAIVIGKEVNGERTKLSLSDYGNLFNRSSVITPDDAPDWTSATEEEKLKYGYITDGQGIVNNEEDTANIHLIS